MAGVKTRWDIWNNPVEYDEVFERTEDEKESKLESEMEDCISRQVYNVTDNSMSFMGRRATDSKLNTHVFLPRSAVIRRETALQPSQADSKLI